MFIWDFVANPVMDALMDWCYSQIIGFLGAFFAQMGNMGVELFDLPWVQAVALFFSQLGWALFAVSLVGNTCMHHLFLSISPDSLVHAPYNPAVSEPLLLRRRNTACMSTPARRC